jgi:beta-glucanase (GH16 family)
MTGTPSVVEFPVSREPRRRTRGRGQPARARVRTAPTRKVGILNVVSLALVALALALLGTDIWTSDSLVPSDGAMPTPAGYTAQQLLFDDQFSGTTLDSTRWNSYLGAQGQRWTGSGLPTPYSGGVPTNNAEYYDPKQVSVDYGLTLTARRAATGDVGFGPYSWVSGVVTTEGKFSLPVGGWYVQVKAKMPDQTRGMWPAIWFLPGVPGTAANEFDGYEGGFVGADPNQIMHSNYFADQGPEQKNYSVKSDVTAGYHIYGFRFIPGHSITAYFDGRQVWQVDASSDITITPEPYEIILELQVAGPGATWWHSGTTGATRSASMDIAEVRAYSDS